MIWSNQSVNPPEAPQSVRVAVRVELFIYLAKLAELELQFPKAPVGSLNLTFEFDGLV